LANSSIYDFKRELIFVIGQSLSVKSLLKKSTIEEIETVYLAGIYFREWTKSSYFFRRI